MSIRLIMAASLAVTLITSTAVGETSTVEERHDRFQLFANCEPMGFLVEELNEDAAKIGLGEESIQAAGESRLRSARLYNADALQYLYIQVTVTGQAFNTAMQYKKIVHDPLSGEIGSATAWYANSTGTHAGNSGFILSSVSRHLDEFLVEFLRVNEEACG